MARRIDARYYPLTHRFLFVRYRPLRLSHLLHLGTVTKLVTGRQHWQLLLFKQLKFESVSQTELRGYSLAKVPCPSEISEDCTKSYTDS